jgi:hypothetical protein
VKRSRLAAAAAALGLAGCGEAPTSPSPEAPASKPATTNGASAVRETATAFGFEELPPPRGATADDDGAPAHIPEAKGGGVALFDYDGDGKLDLLVSRGSAVARAAAGLPSRGVALFRGGGDGSFTDVTAAAGLAAITPWIMAPVAADLDGDGDADLLFTALEGLFYYRNDGGRFVAAPEALPPGAAETGWSSSAACFDADDDGDLDVYVARYLRFDVRRPPVDGADGRTCRRRGRPVLCGPRGLDPLPDLFLRNRGGGVFEDATTAAGFDQAKPVYGLGVLVLDYDRDGRPDVFVANDATPNRLWRNRGDGRFVETAVETGVAWSADGAPEAGMGVDAADLNGDGVDDLVVTNFEAEPNDVYLSRPGLGYLESSARVRTAGEDRPHVGWGVALRDFDGDGRLDLFVANGHVYDGFQDGAPFRQPAVLHLGSADGTFRRFRGPGAEPLDAPRAARAAACGDFDDDGDPDLAVVALGAPPTLLRNRTPDRLAWYGVRVRGPGGNRDALGAEVEVVSGALAQRATVRAHAGFQTTQDPRLVFRFAKDAPPPLFRAALGARRAAVPGRAGSYVDLVLP